MNKKIHDINVLIIEDENKNVEILERILLGEGTDKIRSASNTEDAINLIDQDYPDLILLDLKIPYKKGGMEDSINSFNIIMEVERINRIHDHQIKIIIISGTTQERGLQKLIARDKSLIQHMFDKGLMGHKPDDFREELLSQINKVINFPIKKQKATISILENIDYIINPLKEIDYQLYAYYHDEVLCNYEEITDANEKIVSQGIIIRCGIIIEDLIQQFEGLKSSPSARKLTTDITHKKLTEIPSENESSIREKLIKLTGRVKNYENKKYDITGTSLISRQASEFAIIAYRNRNHASHNGKSDHKNENIFHNNNFTKEHALTSITLLTPLLQDYVNYKSN